jgi:DNA-binding LacI/PurR family transcriptional regulator
VQKSSWRKIADDLTAKIEGGELLPGARIETEEALAARLSVSRHTAHRALHELQRQGLITRQRRWGSVVASAKPKGPHRIAYLVDFAGGRFQADILMHIEHALEDSARLVVSTSKSDQEREAENLDRLATEVDGIICYPSDGDANAAAFNRLAASGYPLVLVDRAPRGCEHLVVLTDNARASEHAVRDLVNRGHRRIAFLGSNNDAAQSVRERHEGYLSAVAELDFNTRAYERWIPIFLESNPESMFQAVIDAFTAMQVMPDPPTAAFCVQDVLAMGLIEACSLKGLTLGRDFDIATYNDYGSMFMRKSWAISRILQQVDQISLVAVERLRSLMNGQEVPTGPIRIPARYMPAGDGSSLLNSSSSAAYSVPDLIASST